jgi:hypothetical protein
MELHPEIRKAGLDLSINFEEADQRYTVKVGKAGEERGAYLEKSDADACVSGGKCLNLAVLVTQLMAELEDAVSPRKPG